MNLTKKITLSIRKINPNAQYAIWDNNLNNIEWQNSTTPISKSNIEAQFSNVIFEDALDNLRRKRNDLLSETDFYAVSDVTMSDDMKTYRQALRDLPSGLDTVEKVEAKEFPTKPE